MLDVTAILQANRANNKEMARVGSGPGEEVRALTRMTLGVCVLGF